MKKFLQITVVIFSLVIVVAMVAPMLLRGKIAGIVKSEANAMLNARLDFEMLDVSLLRHFPNASLELEGLTLVGVDRFEGDTIVAAKRISVVVNLMSVFSAEGFEVKKILLDKPSVYGHKLADGAVNWDVMKVAESGGEITAEEVAAEAASAEETGASSFKLAVRDFRIDDASIRYADDSTNMQFRTHPASLKLKGDMSAAESEFDLKLLLGEIDFVQGGIKMLSKAEMEFNATIAADLAESRFTLSNNTLRLNAIEMSIDGWVQMLESEALAMDLKADVADVRFKDVLSLIPAFYTRDFRNLTASGQLSMALWARGEMHGAILPAFELSAKVEDGAFQYSSLPKAVDQINIAARIANPGSVMDRTEVEIQRFGLRMAGNTLAATLHATNLMSDPTFRASADGKVDLGAIREVYPLDKGIELGGEITADVKVAGRMSDIEKARYEQMQASGTMIVENVDLKLEQLPEVYVQRAAATITPKSMTLGELGIKVGGSDIAANGQLSNYLGWLLRDETLAGRLYVKSDLLDLNEMLAAMTSDGTTDQAETSERAAVSAPEIPENLSLSLGADFGKVLFQKMEIENISGEIAVKGGALSLDKLSLGLFDGTGKASGSYSTAAGGSHPALKMALSLAGASFSKTFDQLEMVQKLVPIFKTTGGDYSLSLDMTTTLDSSLSPVMKTLQASGEIGSADIRVQNIEAFDQMATILKDDRLRKIEAKDVTIGFTIRDGRLTTRPFDLKMGAVKMNLSGSTGLDQTIDYTARVDLPANAAGGMLQSVDVGIGGTFSKPKISVDVKKAAQEAAKKVVEEQLEKLTGNENISEEIGRQAENLRQEAASAGEKLVATAKEQSQKLVDAAAKKGTLAKIAAEKAGEKLVKEAEKQAANLIAEAEAKIAKLESGQ